MDNLQNQNSPLQGFEALESFISSFLLCDAYTISRMRGHAMPVRSRPPATSKTRSRSVNSIKLKGFRDLATSDPLKERDTHHCSKVLKYS